MRSPFALVAALAFLVSCGPKGELKAGVPEALKPIQGELLVFPYADAEALLGREVTSSEGGGFKIADARAPGCEVLVRRTKAQFRVRREAKTSQLAAIGAGYAKLLALEAKYGRDSQATLELENTELLEGDLRGTCGKTVIAKLFVGRGKRRVFGARQMSARGSVMTPVGDLAPRGESKAEEVDELAWSDDQAYAFETRELGGASSDLAPVSVDVRLPSIVMEGQDVQVAFESARPAWLVVYYVDSEKNAQVLWPSNEEPSPNVKPGQNIVLPSPAEQAAGIKLRPMLAKGTASAREQLVVYAFSDKRDFDLVKPASGSSSADGIAFTEELAKKLRDVPASRWSRTVLGYTNQAAK